MSDTSESQPHVKAIDAAMSRIFADIRAIEKGKENKFFNFHFRGIDDVYAAFHPIFAAHKVFLRIELLEHKSEDRTTRDGKTLHHIVTVRFTFRSGEDGSEISSVAIGEASDTGDKGATKAMSIALKYLMFQTFLVPVDNPSDDADNDGTTFTEEAIEPSDRTKRSNQAIASRSARLLPSRLCNPFREKQRPAAPRPIARERLLVRGYMACHGQIKGRGQVAQAGRSSLCRRDRGKPTKPGA